MYKALLVLMLGLLSTTVFAEKTETQSNSLLPDWFAQDFNKQLEQQKSHKHQLLFFHKPQQTYSHEMLKESFQAGPIGNFIKSYFRVISIDITGQREIHLPEDEVLKEKELAEKFKIEQAPTLIFLDDNNKTILRLNGKRSPYDLKQALNFVVQLAYKNQQSLADYIDADRAQAKRRYRFSRHPNLQSVSNFKNYPGPVAMLFEDRHCNDCLDFHQHSLNTRSIKNELGRFLFVRFNAHSKHRLIDFDGTETSPVELVKRFKLNYRPGIILFDSMQEVARVDSQLSREDLLLALRYVRTGAYKKFASLSDYMTATQNKSATSETQ